VPAAEAVSRHSPRTSRANRRAVVGALPLVLPTWALAFYFGMQQIKKK
jgi:hypothetical protein